MKEERGAGMAAVLSVRERQGRGAVDSEIPVRSLEELYEHCRRLGPHDVVRLALRGEAGEVTLEFRSYIRQP